MAVKYDFSDISKAMDEFYNEIIAYLVELGESAYKTAVDSGKYQNITGNLRSSIGYVITMNGKIVKEGGFTKIQGRGINYQKVDFTTKNEKVVSFWAKGKSGDGSEGSKQGLEYARSLALQLTKGFTLIVVAGMDYASYVNSKGLDVIDTAEAKVITMLK